MTSQEAGFLMELAFGAFSIDTKGRIWRHLRMAGGSHANTPSVRVPVTTRRAETAQSHDHLRVQFSTPDGRMWVYAHRAVWMVANHREIPSGLEINHKDGDPANNAPENLELATRQENTLHAGRVLKRLGKKNQLGEANSSAKVTEADVRRIRELWAQQTMAQREIAQLFGIKQGAVSCIILRKSWAHVK